MENLITQQINQGELIINFTTNTQKTGKQYQTLGFFEGRRLLLDKYWSAFELRHREIILKKEDKDAAAYFGNNYFNDVEVQYAIALGSLLDAVKEFQSPVNAPTSSGLIPSTSGVNPNIPEINNGNQQNFHIKLPAIVIPTFSGDYSSWTSFYDLFDSLVVQNNAISNVNKLHHLKTSLSGEAELVLRKFAIEEKNFVPAWKHLQNRYANKRLLTNAHFAKLVLQQKIGNMNAVAIRRLHDISTEALTSLQSLLPEELQFDNLVIYILTQKLDVHTVQAWEESIQEENDFPSLEDFLKFLETHCRTQDLVNSAIKSSEAKSQHVFEHKNISQRAIKTYNISKDPIYCGHCSKPHHSIYKCYKFKALSPAEREDLVREKNWCTRCLSPHHQSAACTHSWICSKCNGSHHYLLHQDSTSSETSVEIRTLNPSTSPQPNSSVPLNHDTATYIARSDRESTVHINHASNFHNSKTLLGTAQVLITSSTGQDFKFRALIDPGSDSCLMSHAAASLLKLPLQKYSTHIKGLAGTSVAKSSKIISCTIRSIHDKKSFLTIDAVIMPHLTTTHPPSILRSTTWEHLKHIPLADPTFYNSEKIDLILGADTYYYLFLPDIRKGPPGSPTAQQTLLGYVLLGQILNIPNQQENLSQESREITSCFSEATVCEHLRKFWELEEIVDEHKPTKEEEYCELHFQKTHRRKPDGRYVVDLPFKSTSNIPIFGNSKNQAYQRLFQTERRLENNPDLKSQYDDFMKEYLHLGHMHPVSSQDTPFSFYLPHHAILKPTHTSTKLRVVFDASAKDTAGKSLNDTLLVGPTIQQELLSILLRWRKHRFALTSDAEKMYRQIEINPSQTSVQRILWRNQFQQVEEYELSTVTYGTACAPFLAVRTIHQLANDEKLIYPIAANRTIHDMYVDDFISGCDSLEDAKNLQRDMVQLFKRGGFNLRKWSSNSPEILDNIPLTSREADTYLNICRDNVIKTLGIYWHTILDELHFTINISEQPQNLTKRELLSDVSKLFDPLGLLAPVIILAKILFQSLWLKGLSWDEPLPDDILQEWLTLRSTLPELSSVKVPRWIGMTSQYTNTELHGFCDASLKAYAAVIYVRTECNGIVNVNLLTSKTRVAPIKRVSLPNLELCGATLLAKLMSKVRNAMDINAQIYTWSDSTIVLDWIQSNVHKQTFVANRVSTILDHLKPEHWHHIRSRDNPADVASRGILPAQLLLHNLWWHGPAFLQLKRNEWPIVPTNPILIDSPVTEIAVAVSSLDTDFSTVIEKFSNLQTLVRVVARCLIFARKCQKKYQSSHVHYISADEHRQSLNLLIKYVQSITYAQEIKSIQKLSTLGTSKIASLYPFICENGFVRVGGRLRNANIEYNQKYPILLPQQHYLTRLIISTTHIETLHGGLKLTLATLRQQYWVPNSRTVIRSIIHKCITCHRYSAQSKNQLMSALPKARVNASKAFSHSGVDYAGPFNLRLSKHRGRGTYKGFVAVFVCMATKAIHIELASDLSSKSFLAAFKRFVSRRGFCSDIYSDNGTNFVGANRELKSMFEKTMTDISTTSAEILAIKGTKWHFIPANSPHFGGLWEAAVKAFKHHLKRIINQATLTYEEFNTLIISIEASLNSRPLCPMTSDPNDMEALTPGHFLTGGPLNAVPEPSVLEIQNNRLDRWKLLIKMHQDFWKTWSKEYLCELQQRPNKWRSQRDNLQVGDLVIIRDDRLPPSNWQLARVKHAHPGEDGCVRVVTLKYQGGETKRAVNRVCRLPIDQNYECQH